MTELVWVSRQALVLLHAESIADHGGLPGLRDAGLLDSALARPLNLHAYENVSEIAALAACYGVALARNHPFNDGNKRAGFVAALLFAALNGLRVEADQADAALVMLGVAEGSLGQAEFAAWIRLHGHKQP